MRLDPIGDHGVAALTAIAADDLVNLGAALVQAGESEACLAKVILHPHQRLRFEQSSRALQVDVPGYLDGVVVM